MKKKTRELIGILAWIISTIIGFAFAVIAIKLIFFP